MFRRCRKNRPINGKIWAGILIGLGLGIFLILYLPLIVWLYIMAILLVALGIKILLER